MMTSPEVSWLFFKARAKCPYLCHTGRASNAEKQPTGRGPKGCVARRLRIVQICALLPPVRLGPPCRRPILNATKLKGFKRRYTSLIKTLRTNQSDVKTQQQREEHRHR